MRQILFLGLLLLSFMAPVYSDPIRKVEGNVLISSSLPSIKIQLDRAFHFLGSFPFRIQQIAAGNRYVFIDGTPEKVQRMFIAQFESFLPESTEIYRYNFDQADVMGKFRFRSNTFAFNVQDAIKENPESEASLTQKFLQTKGYKVPDEWMASRFLTLGDPSRKSEMILFYMEPVAATGHRLPEFYNGEEPTMLWRNIAKQLDTRSRTAFRILK
jgi:hypothetical protein